MSEATATDAATGRPLVLRGLAGLQERLGTDLGVSSWRTVTQQDISTFATLTGDEQWIHVDPERAKAKAGPDGTTIQHGFLTLGLATGLLWEVCTIDGFGVVLNDGLNKVRFPAPPAGRQSCPHARGAGRGERSGRERRGSGLPVDG